MIRGLVLDLGPHPEVVGAVADDEVAGVGEQLQVVPDLPEPVGADLPGDPAVGDDQARRLAEPLEVHRVGRVRPVSHGPEVVPAGDAVARTDDIRRQASGLEGRRAPVGDIESGGHGPPPWRCVPRPGDCKPGGKLNGMGPEWRGDRWPGRSNVRLST